MTETASPTVDPAELDPDHYRLERYQSPRAHGGALRAYYAVKPLMPRRLQLALRRRYARRQAHREFPSWPIEPLLVEHDKARLRRRLADSGEARVPLVNPWPDGRRFAAILTHDVEGPEGVDNVLRVIDVERRHGLVSSWNFVAEWYPIPDGLFDAVRKAGCEVGLHGIRHDGRLFESRAAFESNLLKIHDYLRRWDAVGFRSPATHRNAEWMPELGCLYDSSFPDSDPFEPQGGGCCSIFPFIMDGLVELPITLTQDHTLWEILRQDTIDLWTRKSDWIIDNHGLINVIVHPDYVLSEHRLGLYERFCAWLRERLDCDAGWHDLPREVAAWWRVRDGLSVESDGSGASIAGGAAGDPWAVRATVAWASEREGEVVIDA